MNNNHNQQGNPNSNLSEAVSLLRDCQPLVTRLKAHGITIELTPQEIKILLNFEKLVQADYSESQWSYLRVASGIQVSGVAVLSSCLTRYLAA